MSEDAQKINNIDARHLQEIKTLNMREVLDIVGVKNYDELITLNMTSQLSSEAKIALCSAIHCIQDRKAITLILKMFEDVDTVWESAKSLIRLNATEAVPDLIKLLLENKNHLVRKAAAHTLGFLNDKRAACFLIKTMKNRQELAAIRGQAAESLGYLKTKLAVSPLIEALDDDSIEVRFWAVFSLGELRSRKALPKLRQLHRNDHSVYAKYGTISQEACKAISSIVHKKRR